MQVVITGILNKTRLFANLKVGLVALVLISKMEILFRHKIDILKAESIDRILLEDANYNFMD